MGAVAVFALPERCAACGREADSRGVLCAACWAAVPAAGLVLCTRCLAREREPVGCTRHRDFRAGVAWVYDERAAALVGAFKYAGRLRLAPPLAEVLAAAMPAGLPVDLVTEVPLHPARRRERGYNQAELLAAALGRRLRVPHLGGLLARVRPTAAQAGLGGAARRANVAGAFAVRRPEWVEGRRILLVDDVVTTGATLEAALEVLARAGAEPVAAALAWAQ